jgi:hypothetical protein
MGVEKRTISEPESFLRRGPLISLNKEIESRRSVWRVKDFIEDRRLLSLRDEKTLFNLGIGGAKQAGYKD